MSARAGLAFGFAGLALAGCAAQRVATAAPAAAPASPQAPTDAPPTETKASPVVSADVRARPPAPGPPPKLALPIPRALQLSNGLPVLLLERHDLPIVTVELGLRSGQDTDPARLPGLASFAVQLLDEGTQSREGPAVALAFEELGAVYRATVELDSARLQLSVLAQALEPALDVLAEVALRPAFRPADVERERALRLGELLQAEDDPALVGSEVLRKLIAGAGHPWAHPALGTAAALRAIGSGDLAAWHATFVRPNNAALVVVGDATEAQLLPALEQRFGGWRPGKLPRLQLPAMPPPSRRLVIVDKPDAPQSQVWLGEAGPAAGEDGRVAFEVLNRILGGSPHSRLFTNLRTDHAYSYSPFSDLQSYREGGLFSAGAAVVADKTAESVAEMVREVSRAGEISEEELRAAKDELHRRLPGRLVTSEDAADAVLSLWLEGLPIEELAQLPARLQAVGRAELAKVARERLHPGAEPIVVVGPRVTIERGLRALGLGPVEVRDASGDLPAAKAEGR